MLLKKPHAKSSSESKVIPSFSLTAPPGSPSAYGARARVFTRPLRNHHCAPAIGANEPDIIAAYQRALSRLRTAAAEAGVVHEEWSRMAAHSVLEASTVVIVGHVTR